MEEEFTWAEKKILIRLWPDKKLWYRFFANCEIADRPLRRSIKSLHRRGYIARDEPPEWKQGMKRHFWLTRQGWRAASRLLVARKGGELFLQILEKVETISELPNDEGERVLELALDIVNMLDTKEKARKVRDVLVDLIKQLK